VSGNKRALNKVQVNTPTGQSPFGKGRKKKGGVSGESTTASAGENLAASKKQVELVPEG